MTNKSLIRPENHLPEIQFPLLDAASAAEAVALFRDNYLDDIQAPDLPRDKCGAGGAVNFRVVTPDGEETPRSLAVIVVNRRPVRAYWRGEAKTGIPPDCASKDGRTGEGDPGGLCAECPMARFGSAPKGRGQACKAMQQLLVLHAGELLPHCLSVPPTSLKAANQYFLGLLSRQIPYWNVITRIALERATSGDGQPYAKMIFTVERYLTDQEKAVWTPIQRDMKRLLNPVAVGVDDYAVVPDDGLVSRPRHRPAPMPEGEAPATGEDAPVPDDEVPF